MQVLIEQVNVSDEQYMIVELLVEEKAFVEEGDHLFTYESSKAAEEVEAPVSGYVSLNIETKIGEEYRVGYVVLEINQEYSPLSPSDGQVMNNDKLNFSKKALDKILKYNIAQDNFMHLDFVTEADVNEFLSNIGDNKSTMQEFTNAKLGGIFETIGDKRIAIVGAGKAALQVFDAIYSTKGYKIEKFFDTNTNLHHKSLLGIPVICVESLSEISESYKRDEFDEIVISFSGDVVARSELFDELQSMGIPFANVIHSSAEISPFAKIGVGNLIFRGVRIGPFSIIGDNNVISARCSIEHNNLLGSGNTFGPCVVFSGSCKVGDHNKFGTMISIEPNVTIGDDNIIGSNLNMIRNIKNNTLVRVDEKLIIKNIKTDN